MTVTWSNIGVHCEQPRPGRLIYKCTGATNLRGIEREYKVNIL